MTESKKQCLSSQVNDCNLPVPWSTAFGPRFLAAPKGEFLKLYSEGSVAPRARAE
jgi:hypothetical protein